MSDRDAKINAVIAGAELRSRHAAAPLIYYKPHVGQQELHRKARANRITIAATGNRFGKSWALCAEIVAAIYGYYVWNVPGLRLTASGDYPPRTQIDMAHWVRRADGLPLAEKRRLLVVTGLNLLRGIGLNLWPRIEEFLPPAVRAQMQVRRGVFGVPILVQHPNGTELIFGSGDQDSRQNEGLQYDGIYIDEPFEERLWTSIWRGAVDRLARIMIVLTPYADHAVWVYHTFIVGSDLPFSVGTVYGSIRVNPYLTDQAREEFLSGILDPSERAARERGDWAFLTHRAFPTFDTSVHVVPPCEVNPRLIIGMSCDPAHRRPYMMMWGAFGPNGEVDIFREDPATEHHRIRTSTLTIRDYVSRIRTLEGPRIADFRVLDPRFGKQHARVKGAVFTSVQEDFEEYGLDFDCRVPGTEREETGIQRIRELLRFDPTATFPLSRPKLTVHSSCINTILALKDSTFAPASANDPNTLPEKTRELYKDARDALRYLVLYPYLGPRLDDSVGYIDDATWRRHNERDF